MIGNRTSMEILLFMVDIYNLRYFCVRFEYFQVRFIQQPIPVMVTLVPNRTRQTLSIPLIAFFLLMLLAKDMKRKPAIMESTAPIRICADSKSTGTSSRSSLMSSTNSTNHLFI